MKYNITKEGLSFETDKWIYECSDGKTVYKRPLGETGPKFLVIGLPDNQLIKERVNF